MPNILSSSGVLHKKFLCKRLVLAGLLTFKPIVSQFPLETRLVSMHRDYRIPRCPHTLARLSLPAKESHAKARQFIVPRGCFRQVTE